MEIAPDEYGVRCQFDRYCKLVLYHEALDYLGEMKRRRDRETSLDMLPLAGWEQFSVIDQYPSDDYVFSAQGYELHIGNELVAAAFASLPQPGQSILILRCVLELADGEIGGLMGMSRSAVQRHRTKALETMRKKLMGGITE